MMIINNIAFGNPLRKEGLVWAAIYDELKPEVDRALGCFFEVPVFENGKAKAKLHYMDADGQKLFREYCGGLLPDSYSVEKRIRAEFASVLSSRIDISCEEAGNRISGIRQGLYFDTREVMIQFAKRVYAGEVPESKILLEARPGIEEMIEVLTMPMEKVRGQALQRDIAKISHLDPAKELDKETYLITDRTGLRNI